MTCTELTVELITDESYNLDMLMSEDHTLQFVANYEHSFVGAE